MQENTKSTFHFTAEANKIRYTRPVIGLNSFQCNYMELQKEKINIFDVFLNRRNDKLYFFVETFLESLENA